MQHGSGPSSGLVPTMSGVTGWPQRQGMPGAPFPVGLRRDKARCLTVRFLIPRVEHRACGLHRTRLSTFDPSQSPHPLSVPSHFLSSTGVHPWSAAAFAASLCCGLLEGSGPSPSVLVLLWTACPSSDSCALSVTLQDHRRFVGVSLPSFPPSFPCLAELPVCGMEDAPAMLEVACFFLPRPRSAAPQRHTG